MADWTPRGLPGVMERRIAFHPDDRGSFGELWRDSWSAPLGEPMRQANLSRSSARVLRGLHYHRRQADLWIVADGHPFIALVDVRPAVRGEGPPVVETIDAEPGQAFYLPSGIAHGFYARDPITLIYLVTNEYDGSDELGFAWDDAVASVPWPDQDPILSPRDADAPSLAELLESLRA
ncbi:MAG: dTDP-4-dehydrorhamnose 3,5-epimerase family protein [Chloroflexota bacterium]